MIAESADVDPRAIVAPDARVWHLAQIREGANVGPGCIIGRGAYIDHGVELGENCKIQNYALVYAPARLERGVFVGPAAVLTNDLYPRAIDPEGSIKSGDDWDASGVSVGEGASIGARAVVLPGVSIGAWSLIAAGAVVTKDVPAHALVVGVPARRVGWVGRSGRQLAADGDGWIDSSTGDRYRETASGLESV